MFHPFFRLLYALTLVVCLGSACRTGSGPSGPSGKPDPAWTLSGQTFAHDPSLVRAGPDFFLFYTGPGVQQKTSSDGRFWGEASAVFRSPLPWWKSAVPGVGRDVWAPDVTEYAGAYRMFYALSTFGSNTSAIGLASTRDLASGAWTDDGLVLASGPTSPYNAIDPNLVLDASGSPWLVFGSFWRGIYLTALDPVTLKPVGQPVPLAERPGTTAVEAPTIVHAGDWYYLFTSWDRCCAGVDSTYKIAFARSASVTGPYLDRAGRAALKGGGTLLDRSDRQWIGPGGQSVFRGADGQWLLVHHAYDRDDNGRPTLRIKNLYFDPEGWPTYVRP